jgi:hypothetical protein
MTNKHIKQQQAKSCAHKPISKFYPNAGPDTSMPTLEKQIGR